MIAPPLASVLIFAILAISFTAIAITALVIGYLEKRHGIAVTGSGGTPPAQGGGPAPALRRASGRNREARVGDTGNRGGPGDRFNLQRFVEAQDRVYSRVLAELSAGRKQSHWMWYVFPQIAGLGQSSTSRQYAVSGADEARAYLEHPVLGARLRECAQRVLEVEGRSASEIFGYPDDLKLRSSMTLFAAVAAAGSVFARVLDKYFGGKGDNETLRRL